MGSSSSSLEHHWCYITELVSYGISLSNKQTKTSTWPALLWACKKLFKLLGINRFISIITPYHSVKVRLRRRPSIKCVSHRNLKLRVPVFRTHKIRGFMVVCIWSSDLEAGDRANWLSRLIDSMSSQFMRRTCISQVDGNGRRCPTSTAGLYTHTCAHNVHVNTHTHMHEYHSHINMQK